MAETRGARLSEKSLAAPLTRRALLHRSALLALSLPVVSAALAACGGGGNGGGGGEGGGTTIRMSEYQFSPNTLTASAGQEVKVTLRNEGSLEHDFVIDNVITSDLVAPGKSLEVTFTAPSQPGQYEFYCSVPGHRELGMVGTLTVQ
ncbi:cupredoxin domain-containing protein [Thermomicrobiaceae bacterium CFH 74404]|uniref:Cupredoxin domain-containing protein n=1 Tax=Thermalbibacter longus TaxID=2951981 RepID=A0AA41WDB9_9BACT|nr:cupredoxin domain-containing protein [Thermalbibacter longus]MCM8749003.1 cupredoxin domain-containing protein [Thermalbibacter longus]